MRAIQCGVVAAALVIPFLLTSQAKAAFAKFDDFNSYPAGTSLNGQGPVGNTWTSATPANATITAVSAGNNVAQLGNSAPNYRLLPAGQAITNANTASTVFWSWTQSAAVTGNNFNFIVTDEAAPANTAGSSEAQFNFDATQVPAGGSSATYRVNNGGTFQFLTTDGTVANILIPKASVKYNGWFVIDNSTDSYKLYLQSDGDPALANVTQMQTIGGSSVFKFRNSPAATIVANDLTTINMGSTGTSPVQFDDIFVDTAAANLANPTAVPEPASLTLCSLLGLGLLARRRRARA